MWRAFLCGTDISTGDFYEHRRQWLKDKLLELANILANDIYAYAIMSIHYHVVKYINKIQAEAWPLDNVIQQWHRLFNDSALLQDYVAGKHHGKVELKTLKEQVAVWRSRLIDISGF